MFKGVYKILILLCVVLVANNCYAQELPGKDEGFGVECNAIAGKVIKHTAKFLLPIPSLSTAYDVNFVWQTCGRKTWQQRRRFPLVGLGFTYTNYGSDSIYGKVLGLYPNLQVPIIKGEKLEWTFRIGFGLGYATKHYSRAPQWDTTNNAIGSNINNFTLFMTDLRYHVNKHWDVQLGANFSHMSNATYHIPNLGINMYGAHVGVRYFPVSSQPRCYVTEQKPLKNRWLLQARGGIAFSESGAAYGPLYKVYLGSVYASRRYRGKNKYFGGIDYSYHQDIYAFERNNEINPGTEKQHAWKSAIFVGDEFMVGRVGILGQMGVYVKEAVLKQDPYYEKLGANFYIIQREHGPIKEMFTGILLKTHKFVAELAEIEVGFGF